MFVVKLCLVRHGTQVKLSTTFAFFFLIRMMVNAYDRSELIENLLQHCKKVILKKKRNSMARGVNKAMFLTHDENLFVLFGGKLII
mgnify:CR=1 FL=1